MLASSSAPTRTDTSTFTSRCPTRRSRCWVAGSSAIVAAAEQPRVPLPQMARLPCVKRGPALAHAIPGCPGNWTRINARGWTSFGCWRTPLRGLRRVYALVVRGLGRQSGRWIPWSQATSGEPRSTCGDTRPTLVRMIGRLGRVSPALPHYDTSVATHMQPGRAS